MKTMKWLLRREFWEHKGGFFWAPVAVATALFLLILGTGSKAIGKHVDQIQINGHPYTVEVNGLPRELMQDIGGGIADGYMFVSAPLFFMLGIVVFFYAIGALYDERRDRSILFWKSLPVSDGATVLSKAATALVVIPLLYVAAATVMSVALLLVGGVSVLGLKGINILPYVFSQSATYIAPFALLSLVPVYLVWALPTVGWLMLVSSWAKSKPLVWALGLPLITTAVLKFVTQVNQLEWNIDWFIKNILMRGLDGVFPGIWLGYDDVSRVDLVGAHQVPALATVARLSWQTLASPHALVGAAVGVAMIVAAVRVRRWRDEG
ncbi:MAG: hypothetical protein ACXU8N_16825 [Telluria sp.]